MLGTKCPSITSRWIQSAPAASTLRTSSPSFEKSDARIDGAMTRGRGVNDWVMSEQAPVKMGNTARLTWRWRRGNRRKNLLPPADLAGIAQTLGGAESLIPQALLRLARRLLTGGRELGGPLDQVAPIGVPRCCSPLVPRRPCWTACSR